MVARLTWLLFHPLVSGSCSVVSQAQSYVFQAFFKCFVLIICFGLYFGLIVLPVALSLVGPSMSYDTSSTRQRKAPTEPDADEHFTETAGQKASEI